MTRRALLQIGLSGRLSASVSAPSCEAGCILTTGVLTAYEEEIDAGSFNIGLNPKLAATVTLPRGNPRLGYAKELQGERVELLLRRER